MVRKERIQVRISVAMIALGAVALLWSLKVESDRAAVLRQLQQHGRQVRAAEAHVKRLGISRFAALMERTRVRYRFLPLERKEIKELEVPPSFPSTTQIAKPGALDEYLEQSRTWPQRAM